MVKNMWYEVREAGEVRKHNTLEDAARDAKNRAIQGMVKVWRCIVKRMGTREEIDVVVVAMAWPTCSNCGDDHDSSVTCEHMKELRNAEPRCCEESKCWRSSCRSVRCFAHLDVDFG